MARALFLLLPLLVTPACAPTAPAHAGQAASVGATAPDFTLPDLDGEQVTLSALRGRTVVLECFNPGCPYVQYAHRPGGPLAELAAERTSESLTWLAINSGAPGKQGHGVEVNRKAAAEWKMSHPILLDEDGRVGRLYGAKTTPQLVVVDPAGQIAYAGALDDAPLGKPASGEVSPHLVDALDAVAAGQPVRVAQTKPYGCSVKY